MIDSEICSHSPSAVAASAVTADGGCDAWNQPVTCQDHVLGVAICGCGWFAGRAHIPAFQKMMAKISTDFGFRIRLVALCSRSKDSMDRLIRRLEPKYRDIRCYSNLEDLIKDDSVHVVDLVLPINEMPDAIEKILAAGKSVLSEKPFAPNPTVAARLWEEYSRLDTNRKAAWCVLENWAWKPSLMLVKELLQVQQGCAEEYSAPRRERRAARSDPCSYAGASAKRLPSPAAPGAAPAGAAGLAPRRLGPLRRRLAARRRRARRPRGARALRGGGRRPL